MELSLVSEMKAKAYWAESDVERVEERNEENYSM